MRFHVKADVELSVLVWHLMLTECNLSVRENLSRHKQAGDTRGMYLMYEVMDFNTVRKIKENMLSVSLSRC